jgi:hypothetical protein
LASQAATSSVHDPTLLSHSKSAKVLLWTYGLLLLTGVVHAIALRATIADWIIFDSEIDELSEVRTRVLAQILVVEAIDTVIIAIAWFVWPRIPRHTLTTPRGRIGAWISSLPILASLVTLNLGYHWLIRRFIGVPLVTDELLSTMDVLGFVAICVQPAIVEEWYCRRLVLDSLQSVMGPHVASCM